MKRCSNDKIAKSHSMTKNGILSDISLVFSVTNSENFRTKSCEAISTNHTFGVHLLRRASGTADG